MTQETFTIENSKDETLELVLKSIHEINGTVINSRYNDVTWELKYRNQTLKCKTYITSNINKVKIKTTATHQKKTKSYEKYAINKLHSIIKEDYVLKKEPIQTQEVLKNSEKITVHSWFWFIGILIILIMGGLYIKHKNSQNVEITNIENIEDSIPVDTYEKYETVIVPDSIYEKLGKEYGQKDISKPKQANNSSQFNNKKVTFKSTFYDKERNNVILNTNYEITYHTIDFNRKIVTQKSKLNGHWIEYKYPINGFYEDGLTNVIIVNDLGVKEIWFSPTMLNLGYDYMDGSRIACYGLAVVK